MIQNNMERTHWGILFTMKQFLLRCIIEKDYEQSKPIMTVMQLR